MPRTAIGFVNQLDGHKQKFNQQYTVEYLCGLIIDDPCSSNAIDLDTSTAAQDDEASTVKRTRDEVLSMSPGQIFHTIIYVFSYR